MAAPRLRSSNTVRPGGGRSGKERPGGRCSKAVSHTAPGQASDFSLITPAPPSGPGTEVEMFRYRLHSPGGDDLGEATYAQIIHADEGIIAGHQPALPRPRRNAVRGGGRVAVRRAAAG